jgi:formiminotetrahydrofolate cyclodeaminase
LRKHSLKQTEYSCILSRKDMPMPEHGSLTGMTLQDFLDELSSGSPAPGGGSIAALAGAAGASLIAMVCSLTLGKKQYSSFEREIGECLAGSEELREVLTSSIDEDTRAFIELMSAYRMRRGSPEDKNIRDSAINRALERTVSVPLNVAERSLALLRLAKTAAEKGNINTISDAGVAVLMLDASLKGAIYNVRINLRSLKDPARKGELSETADRMLKEGAALKESVLAVVEEKLGRDLKT